MNRAKVSIILPIYNVEKYLDRCMHSLLGQTLKDIEIIMVDDGSPDNCPQMCDEYAYKDSRIKVVHKRNGGLGYARNTGLAVATGEYIAFVDSDDFVDVKMYQSLYEKSQSENLDAIYCGFYEYFNEDAMNSRQEVDKYTLFEDSECQQILRGMLSPCGAKGRITKYEMSVWHSIYKKDIFTTNNVEFCSEKELISEDIIFHIDFICHCKRIGFMPNKYYFYCLNETSLSKKYRRDRLDKVDALCEYIFMRVKRNGYTFPVNEVMFFACLSLRYPLTVLKTYDMTQSETKYHIREMVNSLVMRKWLKLIPWRKLPLRYKLFFFCIRIKWIDAIYIIINSTSVKGRTTCKPFCIK